MKKRIVLCLLALALLSVMTGCGKKKDADPLTVTLWHVYGGEVDSPLNGLIEQFNSTIGVEQNIRVKVELVSNSGSIHKSVLAAANSDPGAPSLPDMFVSYPKTVLALPDQDMIVDYRDYFSPEELETFICRQCRPPQARMQPETCAPRSACPHRKYRQFRTANYNIRCA